MWLGRAAWRRIAALIVLFGLLAGGLGQASAQEDDAQEAGNTSDVTISVSSSDPAVASTLPEGASWSISSTTGGGVVASGVFSGDQLELPTSIAVATPVPYDDYLVTVDATWAFEPYEHVHTIDSPAESLEVVLDPYVEQPVASSLSLSIADGSEADVSLRWALDDAGSQENVAGGSGVYSLPTVLWEGTLMPGDYWVSIYPDGDYTAISEMVTVTPRVPTAPFAFELSSTQPDPTATPTDEPTAEPTGTSTAAPTETPTAEPTHADKGKDGDKGKDDVDKLPSTGHGSDTGSGNGVLAMGLGVISLLLMAVSLTWRQRRSEVYVPDR